MNTSDASTRSKGSTWLLGLWGVLILGVFFASSGRLVYPLKDLLFSLALAALSVWAFLFSGWRVFKFLKRGLAVDALDPVEETALELGTGVATAMGAIFAMGVTGLLAPLSGALLLGVLCLGDPRPFLSVMSRRWSCLSRGPRHCLVLLLAVGGMTLLESLAPATSQDALVYHLAVPARYIREGGFVHIPGNFFASFPQNVELLFTLALLLEGSPLANFYHWMLGAASVLAIAALARRLGGGRGGSLAAVSFATIPTVALISGWAYVDLGVVFFTVLAILATLNWWRAPGIRWLLVAGLFTGLAGGTKYTGGLVGVLVGVTLFFEGALRRRALVETLSFFGVYAVASLLVVCPWYIKNWIYTGNPVYPFLYTFFGGEGWDLERAVLLGAFLKEWGSAGSILDVLSLPLRITFEADFFSMDNFDGFIGPAFLLMSPLIVMALRSAERRLVFCLAIGFALFWVVTTHQIRFLLPALACVSALLGAVVADRERAVLGRVANLLLAACFVFNALLISTHFATHNPIPVVFGYESRDAYLEREIPGGDYRVFAHINEKLSPEARVLFAASGNPVFLCRRDYHMDAIFENHTLKEILASTKRPLEVRETFRRGGFTHLLFRWDLVFDPTGRKSDLTMEEQLLLKECLNRFGRLEFSASGTALYALDVEAREGGPDAR